MKNLVNSADPLILSIKEFSNTGKTVIDNLNTQIKNFYIEANALIAGVLEITNNLRKMLPFISKKE